MSRFVLPLGGPSSATRRSLAVSDAPPESAVVRGRARPRRLGPRVLGQRPPRCTRRPARAPRTERLTRVRRLPRQAERRAQRGEGLRRLERARRPVKRRDGFFEQIDSIGSRCERPEHAQRRARRPRARPRRASSTSSSASAIASVAATQPVERLRLQRTPGPTAGFERAARLRVERVRRRQRLLRVPFRDEQLQHGDVPEPHGLGDDLAGDRPRRGAFLANRRHERARSRSPRST